MGTIGVIPDIPVESVEDPSVAIATNMDTVIAAGVFFAKRSIDRRQSSIPFRHDVAGI